MRVPEAKKILLVEDDIEIRECLTEFLRDEGYTVSAAENGFAALSQLRSADSLPSLILLDLMMPIMDGFQFREQQMLDSELSGIPTAMLSAHGQVHDKARHLGLSEILRKPIELDDLLRIVETHCTLQ
ncbi:MAG: response regulator [Bdellovibrionota bacterium]